MTTRVWLIQLGTLNCSLIDRIDFVSLLIMFRLPGADRTPDKAAVEEERRRAKQNVWFTMKAFVAYVVLLRLGKMTFYLSLC